jgi:hypothetical protein
MRGTDAADPRLVLEIALVRLARRDTGGPLQVLADRVERLEQRLSNAPPSDAPAAPAPSSNEKAAPRGKKPALGAFKQPAAEETPPPPPTPEAATPAPPPADASPSADAGASATANDDGELDLDDVIVAWNAVLESLPRSLRSAIQEAQPLSVAGNVITFGVSKTQMDNVKPKFQKAADVIREHFTAQLGPGPRPKFKFAVHSWTGANGGGRAPRATAAPATKGPAAVDAGDPGPEPPPEDPTIDLVDLEELVDAPPATGAAVDSISRLEDAFGATVVEEVPRT